MTIKDQLAKGADAVHDAADRVRDEWEGAIERHQLTRELDALFGELGVEVYQRMAASDPVEDSVVVKDLVKRIAEVETRRAATSSTKAEQRADTADG